MGLQMDEVIDENVAETEQGMIVTGRISYWPGKVNLHLRPGSSWQADPDCVSASGIDALEYCKKFFPSTTSVQSVSVTKKPPMNWNTRDCGQQYTSGGRPNGFAILEIGLSRGFRLHLGMLSFTRGCTLSAHWAKPSESIRKPNKSLESAIRTLYPDKPTGENPATQ